MVPSIAMYHYQFIYTQWNSQTTLFLTIQFNISHLFAHSLNVEQSYFIHMYDCVQHYNTESERIYSNVNEGVPCIPQNSRVEI